MPGGPLRAGPDRRRWVLGVVPFALLGAAYWYGRATGVPEHFLPSSEAVVESTLTLFGEDGFAGHIADSILRMVVGFALAVAVAWPLGLLMGVNRWVHALFEPVFGFVRYVPISVVIPLCILWFGTGELQKVVIIVLGAFFQMVLMIADAAGGVRKEYFECARTLGARRDQQLLYVLVPASLPATIDSFRLNFGLAWTFLIFAELLGATSGIGLVVARSQRYLLTGNVVVCTVVVGLIGIVSDAGFRGLRRLAAPWARALRET